MKKNILTFIFCVLTAFNLSAQKLKPAFLLINQGEYEEAEILFNRATNKQIEPAAAYFGLGQMCLDTASGRYDLKRAFDFFQKSKEKFLKTDPKTVAKFKEFYGIKPSDADSMMRVAAEEDFRIAKKHLDQGLFVKFKAKYRKVYKDLCDSVVYLEDSINYKLACRMAFLFVDFKYLKQIENKEKHNFKDSVQKDIVKIQDTLYKFIVKFGDIELMRDFCDTSQKYYPYHNIKTEDTVRLAAIQKFVEDTCKVKWDEKNLIPKIDEFAPHIYSFLILKDIVKPYIKKKDYTKAVSLYMKFRHKFPDEQKHIDKIIGLLSDNNPPVILNERELPKEINSPLYECSYAPVITPDMKKIFFCQDMDFRKHAAQEDIYVSVFKDGKWQLAEPFARFGTYNNNESPKHLYPDESQFVFFNNGRLCFSSRQEDGSWSAPYEMTSKQSRYGERLNEFDWQSDAYFSSDGQALLFAARDIIGSTDIYVCVKQKDGEWGAPINLGETINTDYTDRSPRLSPDLKTLFFTSEGHYGLGGLDVFMSRRLSDTSWTKWSEPINLGKNINTCDDEDFFFVGYDGKTILYSRFDANWKSKIYMGFLPDDFRAESTSILSGRIVSSDGKAVPADIIWEDLKTGTHLGILKNDPVTGEFSITLPLGREYAYFIEAEGYCPVSGIFNTKEAKESVFQDDSLTIFTIREVLENEIAIKIKNLFFDFDKADLKPESLSQLKHIAEFFKTNPDLNIEISGHTDKKGSEVHNLELSMQRAENVRRELIKLGVPEPKIMAKGYGSTKPVSQNDDENRRVEFKLFK